MYILERTIYIDSSHKLKGTKSLVSKKCLRQHGHTWRIKIFITANELIDGMVIDFGKIKEVVNELDHQNLNDFFDNPTAENIAAHLYDEIDKLVKQPHKIKIKVWETLNSCITYYGTKGQ